MRGLALCSLVHDVGSLSAGVPRVFDRIHNGVISKIDEKGGIAAKLFHWGLQNQEQEAETEYPMRSGAVMLPSCARKAATLNQAPVVGRILTIPTLKQGYPCVPNK